MNTLDNVNPVYISLGASLIFMAIYYYRIKNKSKQEQKDDGFGDDFSLTILYLTYCVLPLIFISVSSHYGFHEFSWLLLILQFCILVAILLKVK
jgi:uncharacterized membrane protein